LAYEVTKLVHGEEEAIKAQQAAESLFGKGGNAVDMPTTEITADELGEGMNVLDLLVKTNLIPSKGEGRRLITQGGLYINDSRVETVDLVIGTQDFKENQLMVRKGKKVYHKIVLKK
jgi:tyrosyl-tRNA synthetase